MCILVVGNFYSFFLYDFVFFMIGLEFDDDMVRGRTRKATGINQ